MCTCLHKSSVFLSKKNQHNLSKNSDHSIFIDCFVGVIQYSQPIINVQRWFRLSTIQCCLATNIHVRSLRSHASALSLRYSGTLHYDLLTISDKFYVTTLEKCSHMHCCCVNSLERNAALATAHGSITLCGNTASNVHTCISLPYTGWPLRQCIQYLTSRQNNESFVTNQEHVPFAIPRADCTDAPKYHFLGRGNSLLFHAYKVFMPG